MSESTLSIASRLDIESIASIVPREVTSLVSHLLPWRCCCFQQKTINSRHTIGDCIANTYVSECLHVSPTLFIGSREMDVVNPWVVRCCYSIFNLLEDPVDCRLACSSDEVEVKVRSSCNHSH